MKRMFVTASFQNAENKDEIEHLCHLVKSAGFIDYCFIRDVEKYEHKFDNPKDLMDQAFIEIKNSDYLLIDMTDKPTGRAIEAGMAYALGKEIIVIMKKGTSIKDTTKGIASLIIEYGVIDEIVEPLQNLI